MISTSQFSCPTAPTIRSEASWPSTLMHIDRAAEIGRVQFARAMQAALLAHGEQQGDRRVRQLVLDAASRQATTSSAHAGAGIAAERGGAVGDDAVALAPRLGAGAERHGVEMGREQQPRSGPRSGQVDDQIARLGRQRNALVGVVEADGRRRHADLLQRVADGGGDVGLVSGDALDGEEPHQMVFGRGDIEGN